MRPRLIIGADGRASTVRKQSGIEMTTSPPTHLVAGLPVEGASRWPEDLYTIGVEADLQFYVFPQGSGRLRLYTCHANEQATRWAGPGGAQRFVEAFAGLRGTSFTKRCSLETGYSSVRSPLGRHLTRAFASLRDDPRAAQRSIRASETLGPDEERQPAAPVEGWLNP